VFRTTLEEIVADFTSAMFAQIVACRIVVCIVTLTIAGLWGEIESGASIAEQT